MEYLKVFISWSGQRSRALAEVLAEWLPDVLQSAHPWVSSSDIAAGDAWRIELDAALSKARFGLICITPENVSAPWINFEAGALYGRRRRIAICPYLLGFTEADLTGPLEQFQACMATQSGTRLILQSMNDLLGENSLKDDRLTRVFERAWPALERNLKEIHDSYSFQSDPPALSPQERVKRMPQKKLSDFEQKSLAAFLTSIATAPTASGHLHRLSRDVVLIYGSNQGPIDEVSRYVKLVGLDPMVMNLGDQPHWGSLEDLYRSIDPDTVSCAILLMTRGDVNILKNREKRIMGCSEGGERVERWSVSSECVFFECGVILGNLSRLHTPSIVLVDNVDLQSGDNHLFIDVMKWHPPLDKSFTDEHARWLWMRDVEKLLGWLRSICLTRHD